MTTVNDLKKDDIIYGFCIDAQELEIYQIDDVTFLNIDVHPLISTDFGFYLMFPKELDLEKAVLCNYNPCCTDYSSRVWWIYTVNFDSIKNIIESAWNSPSEFQIKFYFDEYLDIWDQTMHKLK